MSNVRNRMGQFDRVYDKGAPFDFKKLRETLDYDQETGVFTWKVTRTATNKPGERAGYSMKLGYRSIQVFGRRVLEHRLAFAWMLGRFPKHNVDHIDGNPSNNKWANLREATQSQNMCNRDIEAKNTTGFKGVTYHKRAKKFMAQLRHNKKQIYLGIFDTPQEAHRAYLAAAKELHGEFARFSAGVRALASGGQA